MNDERNEWTVSINYFERHELFLPNSNHIAILLRSFSFNTSEKF